MNKRPRRHINLGELLKGAPPMARHYQRLAGVNDAKQLRKARARYDRSDDE